jgi:hypothetical protein
VAWVRRHPDGTLAEDYLPDSMIETVRKESGAWVPLYGHTAPDELQSFIAELEG